MTKLNDTHDPKRRSWVESANQPDTDFPIQNLPHGVFHRRGESPRGGVAIGAEILDLRALQDVGLIGGDLSDVLAAAAEPTLNRLLQLGNDAASALRARLSDLLRADGSERSRIEPLRNRLLVPMQAATIDLPLHIGAFTDFCTSVPHLSAARPGRPARELHPAFRSLPVAYNGRASSITADGVPFERPNGQSRQGGGNVARFGPCTMLDFELEFGAFYGGAGNALGRPLHIDEAARHLFGYVLVNDWSARDIQWWEHILGPFLSKSFRTTISPWIVTAEALAPFAIAAPGRTDQDPPLLPYLSSARHQAEGGLAVRLQAFIRTAKMRREQLAPTCITDTKLSYCFWTLTQMLTHHLSNGCNLRPGDLLASGTVSGPELSEAGCLAELTGDKQALTLPGGESRMWIEDGDEIILRGKAEAPGFVPIGFGHCGAEVLPATVWPAAGSVRRGGSFI